MTPTTHALGYIVEDRIGQLLGYRRWYRNDCPVSLRQWFAEIDQDYRAELLALLRLRAKARRIARQARYEQLRKSEAIDRLVDGFIEPDDWDDPMPVDMNREGQPTVNGAWR